MWLCTQHGFFSIVRKRPGEFHIRARMKQDLVNLTKLCGAKWKIHRSANADYRWRCVVEAEDVSLVMSCLAEAIDYDNFKGRIHSLPDQESKGHAYGTLWSELHYLQTCAETPGPIK